METFPLDASNWSEALRIMAHRSWKRPDQMRLARFYLKKMPFAAATPYEVFASFMSVPRLIAVIKEALPSTPAERQLVAYYVCRVLRKNIKTDRDRDMVERFVAELDSTLTNAGC
ncbi:hypothetical protein ACXZ1M_08215 [Duganella sp. PWIR1]